MKFTRLKLQLLMYEETLLSFGVDQKEILKMKNDAKDDSELEGFLKTEIFKRVENTKCMVCLELIKRFDEVSMLSKCHCFFHKACLHTFVKCNNYELFGCPKCIFNSKF